MNNKYYILGKDHKLIETNLMAWAKFFESPDRIVKQENIGDVRVSTVFLGIDHNFSEGEPLLFETMIFDGKHDGYQDRCTTWEQAEKMHQKAVDLVKP
jgi:hypothetical protein